MGADAFGTGFVAGLAAGGTGSFSAGIGAGVAEGENGSGVTLHGIAADAFDEGVAFGAGAGAPAGRTGG